ncbi:MAG TPA: ATPase domain-containing protein, partial [Actinomycetota bacterium]|nr:ATPase domain-containing protein [Actinomycetota bacterium]
ASRGPGEPAAQSTPLGQTSPTAARHPTGIDELDRALGGGIVAGSITLLAGEPGIGKSTLVLQMLSGLAAGGLDGLLVTAEESLEQVAGRAQRLHAMGETKGVATDRIADLFAACERDKPHVLVVDSIQAVSDGAFDQPAGSLVQVRECAASLARFAKSTGTAVVLVGHVNKDGVVAGPKTLEHLVDSVLSLDGDRTGSLRMLRCLKNRFGSCEETGVFLMEPDGLVPVPDPSTMLLADRVTDACGSTVFCGLQGTRPYLAEVQALVTKGNNDAPGRRVAIGFDSRRLSLLLAVLSKQSSKIHLGGADVFVATSGGITIREPAADLAFCLAIQSAINDVPVDPSMVAIGEVGLAGEIRRVPNVRRRLAEAKRLGFERAVVPRGSDVDDLGLVISEVQDVRSAFTLAIRTKRVTAA